MANKRTKPNEVAEGFASDVKFRSYKNDGAGFDKLEEADIITGVLVSIRDHQITDKRTKAPKDIRVYSIRVEDGSVKKIGGRTILDRMFDDIMDENGGFIVENRRYSGPGYDYAKDRMVRIERGDDTETGEGNPLGTYQVDIEE
jgi:hypothetical protein